MSLKNLCLVLLATALLGANKPAWMDKSVSEWTKQDAQELLSESPWVGTAELQVIPNRSPGERRDSGDWNAGVGQGVGIAGTGILGSKRAAEAIKEAHEQASPGDVGVRWESAMTVRAAENKVGDTIFATEFGAYYSIVLYGVPVPEKWHAERLASLAYIKRLNKPNLKCGKVEIIRHDDNTSTVVYMFPRADEISSRDRDVIFVTQIDRLFVTRYFHPSLMQFEGNLEL